MNTLNIDLETRSGADISKTGVYRYAEDENFDILLFGVSVDHGPIRVYDLACGETVPEEILAALSDNSVIKYAYNASFERVCLSIWLRRYYPHYFKSYCPEDDPASRYLDPAAWRCSMVLAYYNGLPGGLDLLPALALDLSAAASFLRRPETPAAAFIFLTVAINGRGTLPAL